MKAKLTGFVIYAEVIIYLLLHNLQVFTFSDDSTNYRFLPQNDSRMQTG